MIVVFILLHLFIDSALRKLVQQLGEDIALLKQGRDSNTSSTPPSHDIGRSNGNSLRTKSGKATGGQTGHRGHHLPMVSTPDEVVAHVPEICSQCGESLEHISSVGSTRHQVIGKLKCQYAANMQAIFYT
jgi:transposase